MFLRMLKRSFSRGKRNKLLAIVTIAFGATLATAVLSVAMDIGDKVNKELKSYGANLVVEPQMDTLPLNIPGVEVDPLADRRFLQEDKLAQLKMIFWRNNILHFAPSLATTATTGGENVSVVGTWFDKKLIIPTGETVITGVKNMKSWWDVRGDWPEDKSVAQALVTQSLADKMGLKTGDRVQLSVNGGKGEDVALTITGTVATGGDKGDVFVPLDWLQQNLGKENQVDRVEVSALTTPENDLARKAEQDLDSLNAEEFERWYCTAYVESIAYQIEEVIPGAEAKQLRQVAQSEGKILSKIQLLMAMLTIVALASSVLGISNLMTANVLERSKEIGLMKAVGAGNVQVVAVFMTEAVTTGIAGGLVGYLAGFGFAQIIGRTVFSSAIAFKLLVIPLVLLLSIGVAVIGTLFAMGAIIKLQPAEVLHGR